MAKREETKEEQIKREEAYVDFLRKKLNSENYKANVDKEEYDMTKHKFNKAKLKLKFLREGE